MRLQLDEPDAVLKRVNVEYFNFGIGPRTARSATALCTAPCTKTVDTKLRYQVVAGRVESPPFTAPESRDTVKLEIQRGSLALENTGLVLVFVGIGGAGLGGVFLALGTGENDVDELVVPGAISLGAGIATVITGIILMNSSQTRVNALGKRLARAPAAGFSF